MKRAESVTGEREVGRESNPEKRKGEIGDWEAATVIDREDRGWGSQPLGLLRTV